MSLDAMAGPLAVRRTGTGAQTVVCLHPLALSGAFWDPMARALATTSTVLAPDARGHGRSPWDGEPFSVEDMADDVAALIADAGSGPAHVVGLSMGGCTAIALAARHPEVVDRLVLADTTACYGPDRAAKWAARAAKAQSTARRDQLGFQLGRWFTEAFPAQHADEVGRVVELFVATSSAAHAAACRALGDFDGRDYLSRIGADTLVLVGDQDEATPRAMAEEIASGVAGARLEVLVGARHFSLLEHRAAWDLIASHLG